MPPFHVTVTTPDGQRHQRTVEAPADHAAPDRSTQAAAEVAGQLVAEGQLAPDTPIEVATRPATSADGCSLIALLGLAGLASTVATLGAAVFNLIA